ncbi:hypothetical protein AAMO2058_000173700 [Amorphochlora amoebiformis]|uniref:Cytochrome c domain-containing protein n=1 Tax=Amorphochlora amoebiformis TaxID=1561963 RepID=A0A7S0GQU7_9EUKA|mmetsp:Transcript_14149/g.22435  ORF Transcript_14149/g.22435 Transcript_14149/m.22435 type:complete len:280 (+) Transcript_14149:44-883(+)
MLSKGLLSKTLKLAKKNAIPIAVASGVAGAALVSSASASDDCVAPPSLAWSHKGIFSSFDAASMRRGYEVYRQVCSTCHAMHFMCYRNLVGVTHTKEHAEMLAGSIEVRDGPNDEGEMFDRPGKLFDRFPAPYPNEEAARAANGGAYPPDLSLIVKARPHGEDYVFALLTGYKDPPAGIVMRPGLHYNPYFSGGAISMEPPIREFGQVEWQDGTPPTVTQMAKDVCTFLAWASEPETDERKKAGVKWLSALLVAAGVAGYWKRFKWMPIKTRKIEWKYY